MAAVGLAVATLGVAVTAESSRSRGLRERAERAAKSGRWEEVEEALRRYTWYRSPDPPALRLQAHAAWKRKDPTAALRYLEAIPVDSPMFAASQLQRGMILLDSLRLREAESAFLACLRLDPEAAEAQRLLLAVYGVQRRQKDYTDLLWRILGRGTRPLPALILLASGLPDGGPVTLTEMVTEDEAAFRRWIAADLADPYARPAFARFLRTGGLRAEARAVLGPWVADHPDDFEAGCEWAALLLDEDDLDGAAPWLDPVPASARGSPRFWKLRGDWLLRRGLPAEAESCCREAVKLHFGDAEAHFHLKRCLDELGRHDEGEAESVVVRRIGDLKLVARRILEHPDRRELQAEARRLCEEMGRSREARGWSDLLAGR